MSADALPLQEQAVYFDLDLMPLLQLTCLYPCHNEDAGVRLPSAAGSTDT